MSDRAIQLSLEAGAAQLFAPEVQTHGHFGGVEEPPPFRGLLEVPKPSSGDIPNSAPCAVSGLTRSSPWAPTPGCMTGASRCRRPFCPSGCSLAW